MGLALAIMVPILVCVALAALIVTIAAIFGIVFAARARKQPENKGGLMIVVIIACSMIALVGLVVFVIALYAIIGFISGALSI